MYTTNNNQDNSKNSGHSSATQGAKRPTKSVKHGGTGGKSTQGTNNK